MTIASGLFNLRLDFLETLTQDMGDKQFKFLKQFLQSFSDGTGLGQIQKLYGDLFSQAQSVNNDIDLNPGPAGAFGAVLFNTLKGIIVINDAASPGNITVGNVTNGITSPFGAATHSQIVAPGGIYANLNPSAIGFTVTAGTADLVRIASAANAGTYTGAVVLLGT
jgi:hypothetical protein